MCKEKAKTSKRISILYKRLVTIIFLNVAMAGVTKKDGILVEKLILFLMVLTVSVSFVEVGCLSQCVPLNISGFWFYLINLHINLCCLCCRTRKVDPPAPVDGINYVTDSVSRLDMNTVIEPEPTPIPAQLGAPECKCGMPLCICEAPAPIPTPALLKDVVTMQLRSS